jgi:hypothetical protein
MMNLLGFIMGFFVANGHSLRKEVAPFSATQAPPIKGVMQQMSQFLRRNLCCTKAQALPHFTASAG